MPPKQRRSREQRARDVNFFAGPPSPAPQERQRDIQNIEREKEFQQFLKDTGRNERNPYGNEGSGIFGALSRKFPGLVTYDNILSPEQIALQNRLAFDRYKKPFAKTNILGQETGADIGAGTPRMGVQPGMRVQTPDGRVVTAQAKPLSGITAAAAAVPYLGSVINFLAPKQAEIPGFEADNPMAPGNIGEDGSNMLSGMLDMFRVSPFSRETQTNKQPTEERVPYTFDRAYADSLYGRGVNKEADVFSPMTEPSPLEMTQAMNEQVQSSIEDQNEINRRLQFQQDLINEARRASGITTDPNISGFGQSQL